MLQHDKELLPRPEKVGCSNLEAKTEVVTDYSRTNATVI